MYKVFINNTTFILAAANNIPAIDQAKIICLEKSTEIKSLLLEYSKSTNNQSYIVSSLNNKESISEFEKQFPIKVAAGGWVFNSKQELLMIKRLGLWDIPKGHLEADENLKKCAKREVEEETGVKKLKIINKLGISRHLFERKGIYKVKETHWYKMHSDYRGPLKPQTEESIEKARWIKEEDIEEKLLKGWKSLYDFYVSNVK